MKFSSRPIYFPLLVLFASIAIFTESGHASAGAEVIASTLPSGAPHHEIIVSVRDQKLLLKTDGREEALYPISTSRFGIGDRIGSFMTPLGKFFVRAKIGMGLPLGAVLKSRTPTGEILKANAPGRDPIVSRILWLEGQELGNRNAYNRGIYIHGTPQEKFLGRPASFGCIRMRSADVAVLCERIDTGVTVRIIPDHLPSHESFFGSLLNSHGFIASHSGTPESTSKQEAE